MQSRDPANDAVAPVTAASQRVVALDLLRGLVMILMAVDHVDSATNPRHSFGDAAVFGGGGGVLSAPDFLTRWCTHLCAPTFVLLAGTSVALSAARTGRDDGVAFDRHLVLRGLVLIAFEVLLVSKYWRGIDGGGVSLTFLPLFLQVLYALGGGLIVLALLRRLPGVVIAGIAVALLVGAEVVRATTLADGMRQPLVVQLLAVPGIVSFAPRERGFFDAIVLYPLLPWLPVMLFGFLFGRRLVAGAVAPLRLAGVGVALIVAFVALRAIDGFGNMALHRRSDAWLEWLHCSKYPPSMTFLAMELGIAFLVLAVATRAESLLARTAAWNPLLVLGQVPLFFYLLHLPAIGALVHIGWLPAADEGGAGASWLGALQVTAVCLPLCAAYRIYKRRSGHRWTRYV